MLRVSPPGIWNRVSRYGGAGFASIVHLFARTDAAFRKIRIQP